MLLGKNKLWGPEKFQCYTTLEALFEIRFRSLLFDVEKRRQCSEVMAIPWDLFQQICSGEMLLGCNAIEISWWLNSNHMLSPAINDKFDSW